MKTILLISILTLIAATYIPLYHPEYESFTILTLPAILVATYTTKYIFSLIFNLVRG